MNVINTKLLIAILAGLGALGALLIHERSQSQKAAAEAAKSAAILQQQKAEADEHRREGEEFRKNVEAEKRKNNVNPAKESKTWQTYVP